MRRLRPLFFCLLLPGLLTACELDRQLQQEAIQQREQISYTTQMHHLHMLINHALQMAAQGADMQLLGKEQGQKLLAKSTELLTRAMSGMEMSKLHRQGWTGSSLMFMTHELSDTAEEMILLMHQLSADVADRNSIYMLNHAIEVAAMGSSLIMLGQQGMAGDIDLVMVNHGQSMLGEASGLLRDVEPVDAYSQTAVKIVQMLIGIPEDSNAPTPGRQGAG